MKKRKILSVLAAIAMAVTALPADFLSVYAESNVTEEYEEIIPDVQRDEELDSFSQPEYSPMFSFPDEVRGVYITPEKDFDIYDENGDMLSEEDILSGINSALDSAENMSLNTVIINTSYNGNVYFSTDMNGSTSPSELCAQAANERGMFVYVTFDIGTVLSGITEETAKARIDRLALDPPCH